MLGIRRREFITASSRDDRFTWRPWAWALCLWCVAWLPLILLSGFRDLVYVLWALVISIPAFTAAVVVPPIFFLINLFRRRWRAATSIVVASITFAFAVYVSREFHDELRWYMLRPYYVAQIEKVPVAPGKIRSIHWDGGLGWEVTLQYYEIEPDADDWKKYSCIGPLKKLAPHYYLDDSNRCM
jgi:hypothetical protein